MRKNSKEQKNINELVQILKNIPEQKITELLYPQFSSADTTMLVKIMKEDYKLLKRLAQ